MLNHIHMVIIISEKNRWSKTTPAISRIIQQFKRFYYKKEAFQFGKNILRLYYKK